MKIRNIKLEGKLVSITKELRDKKYQLEDYTSDNLRRDGIKIIREGSYSNTEGMIGSKWLCGTILYTKEEGLVLNLRECTPYSRDLFDTLKTYFRYQ